MAFGFGFSKQKALSAAEKFVQQGKLQNAIAEYDKILKSDPNDLTVNNTIGDLYSRLGDSAKAIECFKTVGDAYAAQGFTVKGIAMYKKIAKLQPSVEGSLKLAELYTQQGLFNDARAQYLQIAEDFMKHGELEQAIRLFQKVLEMDPENVPMRVKLAEVYVRLGKKKEAWELFSAAAESLRSRGSLAAAEDILKRLLALDPSNSYVLLLRGKAALESDDPKHAIEYLEKASDIDSHPDGLRDLLKAHLQIGDLTKSPAIAYKLLTVHNDPEGLFLLVEGYVRLGQHREALEVYTRHADRLLATESTKLLASLHSMIGHVRDDAGALDELLLLLNKAGESTHVNEVTELLAHASVKDGNLERARDLYQLLATTEPQNPMHMQNYRQMVERLEESSPTVGITAEEGTVIVEELEATAPVVDQFYPDDVAAAVRFAVTDADLFLSYNLPEKAVVPLLGALPQAPCDARLNQRLLALHTRYQRFTEAAVCCRTLESVYRDAGYPEEADRYGEVAGRFEQNAEAAPLAGASPITASTAATPASAAPPAAARRAASTAAAAAPHAPWPMAADTAANGETAEAAHPEFAVQEMTAHAPSHTHDLPYDTHDLPSGHDLSSDLSSEWENSLSVDEPAPVAELPPAAAGETDDSNNPEIAETVEEVRFYLDHFMTDQARAGIEKLETLTSDASILDPLRAALESSAQPAAESEPEIAEIDADEPADFEIEIETGQEPEIATSPAPMAGYRHETGSETHAAAHDALDDAIGDAIDDDGPVEPNPEPAYADHALAEAALAGATHREPAHAEASELTALVADLEASLGESFPQAPAAAISSPVVEHPVMPLPATQPLSNWPAAAATAASRTLEPEPVANVNLETPAAPAAMPAIAAAAGGAAAAATPAMSYSPAPVRPLGAGAQAMHASDSVDLSEMFGELKRELEEEVVAGDDDPETHYNLGVAFREMGLLDEAIAELQKVCTAIDRGKAFAQPVQTYTWLAQCFLDKGVPEAAIRWYEKALNIAGLDEESRMAINYELGSACETAMDKPAALRHFTNVYGANIDYRDVAERIQALKS
jgi:tetratricopeptide (TPR) repeat protein